MFNYTKLNKIYKRQHHQKSIEPYWGQMKPHLNNYEQDLLNEINRQQMEFKHGDIINYQHYQLLKTDVKTPINYINQTRE
jgi:hypothetical protein